MKNFKYLIITCVVLISVTGCKKYPDDPFISLKTPQGRLCSGEWTVTSYTIGGNDSTQAVLDWMSNNRLIFQKGDRDGRNLVTTVNPPYYTDGIWNFSNNKKEIFLGLHKMTGHNYYVGLFGDGHYYWHINELTCKKIKLSQTVNGVEHKLQFKKN